MNVINYLLNFLFPSACPLCGRKSDDHLYNPLCTGCWQKIERYSGPACSICGIPVVSPLATLCGSCMKSRPPFSKALSYGIYEGALKESVHLLKFSGIKRLSNPLGLLLSGLPLPAADGIVPVPLHPKRLRERGFNQAASIAVNLSKKLGIPLMLNILEKVRDTMPQTGVSGKERLKNVKGAYRAAKDIDGLELLLVDDVITTGATIRECARTLRKAGAARITVAALARSMPRQNT